MERSLDAASVVLAGASGGLGSAIGARLAKSGARLVLFGRDASRLAATGLPGLPMVGDLADRDACEGAVEAARSAYGRIDGVVNAAGLVAFGAAETLSDEVIDRLLVANLVGPIRMTRAALPHLERGGFVANISAIVAEHPTAGMAFYSATKAGLSALDRQALRPTPWPRRSSKRSRAVSARSRPTTSDPVASGNHPKGTEPCDSWPSSLSL